MRANAANVAARAAVGADDMLMKWQLLAAEGLAKRQGGGATSRSLLFPPQTMLCHSSNPL
jgi:transcription initiation factor TFIID subunit 4